MGMGIGIGFNTANNRRIQIKDAYGRVTGTISISKSKNKKPKKLKYNSKQISSQLLKTKTAFAAERVAKLAKIKVNMLKQKMGTGEYDNEELRHAIVHAERIERVAKKRKRHLQEEEKIKKNVESAEVEEIFEDDSDDVYYDYLFEDLSELKGEDLQKRMQEYEEMLADLMREMEESMESEEMGELSDLSIIPDVCDEYYYDKIKKKHRADELKDIMEADLKYLKAMFEKYSKEMQDVKNGMENAVSMQIGGVEMPVPEAEPMSVSDIGGYIDQFT